MEAFDIGDKPRLTETFTDINGDLTDPASVSCSVKSPSGTTMIYTYPSIELAKVSTGVYTLDLTISEAGDYRYKWNGTGASSQGYISVRRSLA